MGGHGGCIATGVAPPVVLSVPAGPAPAQAGPGLPSWVSSRLSARAVALGPDAGETLDQYRDRLDTALMALWRERFGERLFDISYEATAADLEPNSRALIDFLQRNKTGRTMSCVLNPLDFRIRLFIRVEQDGVVSHLVSQFG